jgi:hypothetical protein
MSDDLFDVWFEGLLAELKKSSTGTWESGKRVFRAMPNAIERAIKAHSEGLNNDPELLRSYYEGAKVRSDQLAQQGDEYAETLRGASQLFEIKIKEMSGGNGTAPAAP